LTSEICNVLPVDAAVPDGADGAEAVEEVLPEGTGGIEIVEDGAALLVGGTGDEDSGTAEVVGGSGMDAEGGGAGDEATSLLIVLEEEDVLLIEALLLVGDAEEAMLVETVIELLTVDVETAELKADVEDAGDVEDVLAGVEATLEVVAMLVVASVAHTVGVSVFPEYGPPGGPGAG
jgi:hypothetical protein